MARKKEFSCEKLSGTGNTEESMGKLFGLFFIQLLVLLIELMYNYFVLFPPLFKRIRWIVSHTLMVSSLMQLVKRSQFWVQDLALTNM